MSSAPIPIHQRNGENLQKSRFQQTVCLTDWWLVKAENDTQEGGLCVAGFTSREKQAKRVFSSAPILRRCDVFTIETTDGICIVLDGFLNKDRTLENGFPSDACNHFLFGFPPFWNEYHEKFISKESFSKNISVVGDQTHVDSHEKGLGSLGKINAKGIWESKKTRSSDFPLLQTCGNVTGGSKDNWIASEGLENESSTGGCSGEDETTLELPRNNLKSKIKSSLDSICVGATKASLIDKDVEYSRIHDNRGLSACHLYNQQKRAIYNLKNLESEKSNYQKGNFDTGMGLSESTSLDEVGVRTRRMTRLKMKEKNNQTSATASEKVESAYVDREPRSKNIWNVKISGLHKPADEIHLRLLDAGSVKCGFDQVPKSPNQGMGNTNIQTECNTWKAKSKAAKTHHTPAAADNQTNKTIYGKSSSSLKVEAIDLKTGRKLAYASKVGKTECNTWKEKSNVAKPHHTPAAAGNQTKNSVAGKSSSSPKVKTIDVETRSELAYASKVGTTERNTPNEKSNAAEPHHTTAATDNQTNRAISGKSISSPKAKAINVETRRKLACASKGTPDMEETVILPHSSNFKRSRSGRLLTAPLEFWRNQHAIYDKDGTITGIREVIHKRADNRKAT